MKQFVCWVCAVLFGLGAYAQSLIIRLSTDKTTSLVFPFVIRHVDRGSREILVHRVEAAAHILLVKASSKNFSETNLSVITADGGLYSFQVQYDSMPAQWVYTVYPKGAAGIEEVAKGIADNTRSLYGIQDREGHVQALLTGIYIKGGVMYFQLELDNASSIDYDLELLRLSIRDKKVARRTASQEVEVKPLHIVGNTERVGAGQKSVIVVALDKLTLPDQKYLAVQLMEKGGGRHLLLKVRNRRIVRAIPLPDGK